MKNQFIDKLVNQSWNIGRIRGRTLMASMIQRLRAERPPEDLWGDPLPVMTVVGDVAIIPIYGALALNVPDWLKQWGVNLTDVNDIAEEIGQAQIDSRVSMIVLDFDSPGGWSIAGNKLFDTVQNSLAMGGKPILAWCGDGAEVCSAAFQGATPATMFLTGPYASAVGCIGTYLAVLDDTEFWKMMGITIEIIRSGELKGMGMDGLSDPQREFLQSTCDAFGATFRGNVAQYRTLLDPAEMEGQYYSGKEAAKRNFVFANALDLNTAIAKFRRQL